MTTKQLLAVVMVVVVTLAAVVVDARAPTAAGAARDRRRSLSACRSWPSCGDLLLQHTEIIGECLERGLDEQPIEDQFDASLDAIESLVGMLMTRHVAAPASFRWRDGPPLQIELVMIEDPNKDPAETDRLLQSLEGAGASTADPIRDIIEGEDTEWQLEFADIARQQQLAQILMQLQGAAIHASSAGAGTADAATATTTQDSPHQRQPQQQLLQQQQQHQQPGSTTPTATSPDASTSTPASDHATAAAAADNIKGGATTTATASITTASNGDGTAAAAAVSDKEAEEQALYQDTLYALHRIMRLVELLRSGVEYFYAFEQPTDMPVQQPDTVVLEELQVTIIDLVLLRASDRELLENAAFTVVLAMTGGEVTELQERRALAVLPAKRVERLQSMALSRGYTGPDFAAEAELLKLVDQMQGIYAPDEPPLDTAELAAKIERFRNDPRFKDRIKVKTVTMDALNVLRVNATEADPNLYYADEDEQHDDDEHAQHDDPEELEITLDEEFDQEL